MLEHVIEFSSPEVAQAVAAAGRGIALVSDGPRFGLTPVPVSTREGRLVIDLYTARSKEHTSGDLLERLADRLHRFCT